tara:strand:+ start:379 stop:606 length:228 start_codon:yes stop_codon:yes gene_type:complete
MGESQARLKGSAAGVKRADGNNREQTVAAGFADIFDDFVSRCAVAFRLMSAPLAAGQEQPLDYGDILTGCCLIGS